MPQEKYELLLVANDINLQQIVTLQRENAELRLDRDAWVEQHHNRTKLIDELQAKLAAAEAASVTAKAETIARAAHSGQKDTVNGDDYIRHVERVVALVDSEDAKAVAWLHDVLEDTAITEDRLRAAGIPESVVFSVIVLTKQEGDIYENYISTILAVGDKSALAVKRADIEDHLHANCPERLRPRYEKASQALAIDAAKTEVKPCRCAGCAPADWPDTNGWKCEAARGDKGE